MSTLDDLRILDLSTTIAGAWCTRLFAGYGADVALIESIGGGPLRGLPEWQSLGSGKQSITLDVRSRSGRRLFGRLVEQANVVVETFPNGTLESLGLGFTDLYAVKRRIILTSIADDDNTAGSNYFAGLNAFAATAIAAHNADAFEIPQHIRISARSCLAAATDGIGPPVDPPFSASSLQWTGGPAPELGADNRAVLCDEMGLEPADLARLRAAGVI